MNQWPANTIPNLGGSQGLIVVRVGGRDVVALERGVNAGAREGISVIVRLQRQNLRTWAPRGSSQVRTSRWVVCLVSGGEDRYTNGQPPTRVLLGPESNFDHKLTKLVLLF